MSLVFKTHYSICPRREVSKCIMFSGCLSGCPSGHYFHRYISITSLIASDRSHESLGHVHRWVTLTYLSWSQIMEQRLPYAATCGYYANMVQQIEFIIYTNIQPLGQIFLPQVKVIGQGQSQLFKKMFCYHDNLNNNYCISPIFYVKLLLSMEMT